ncbi:MAG: ATP-dependent DNA helicase, partial [Chlamydiae bacterium]|nr:ATP-dependent DNA helicase [Chlamydiota bacterium]
SFTSHEFTLFQSTYTLYQQKLREYNALDFDDLLFLCVHLLKTSSKARELYQKRWSFVLIDEYQDTNVAQYTLTRLLVEKHHNLFVVGDPDQSIYSWRGANIQNILNFEKDFPGAKVIKLEQNYRSTNHILSAANSLIQHNTHRYEKNLHSSLGDGEKVHIRIHGSEHEEALDVLSTLLNHRKKGLSLDKMVVFYRTNAQSRIFEDTFLKAKIPYIIVGGISFYQRREVKDMLSLLRMLFTDSDFLSFSRTINLPKRGLGLQTLAKLQEYSEKNALPILSLCRQLIVHPPEACKLSIKQSSGLQEYLSVLDHLKTLLQANIPLKDLLKAAIERSRYLDYLKEDPETFEDRKANLDALITKAVEWQLENPQASLPHFLEELSLKSHEESSNSQDCIRLMTLHNGKGLEFEVVFLVGLEEDLLPHINSKDSETALEEERRLCYVGMTRAKRFLYMTSSQYRLLWGMPKTMEPSRFLQEIDPKHTLQKGQKESSEIAAYDFAPGTGVLHKDFGKGVVKKSYHTSLGPTYDVFFPHLKTTKSLVAKFAKLKEC